MNKLIACLSALFLMISLSAAYSGPTTNSDMKGKSAEEQIKAINEILADILDPSKSSPDYKKLIERTGNRHLSMIFKDVDTSVVIGFYEHESYFVRSAINDTLRTRKDEATEAINHALETGSPRVRFQLLCFQNYRHNHLNKPTAEMCAMLDTIIHDENIPIYNTDHQIVKRQNHRTEDWPIDIIAYCNRLLDSGSINDCEIAIDLLGRSCDNISESVPRLIAILKNADANDVSNSVIRKLISILAGQKEIKSEVIPVIKKFRHHKDESIQILVSSRLYYLDYERDKQVRFIIDKFKENQTRDTFTAISTIRKDAEELLPFVKELLQSDDKFIRGQARYYYIVLGGSSEILLDMMKQNLLSNNPTEYLDAIGYFRNKRDDDTINFLLETLKKEDINNELKYELCSMLISKKGMFKKILPSIIELLNTNYPKEVPIKAANLLKYGGAWNEKRDSSSAVPALLDMMESEDSEVVKQAREVILKIDDDHEIVVNKLIELVNNSNDKICLNAISQLGYMKEKSINAIGVLADAHNRDNETIKTNSILAIRTILQYLKHNQKVDKADLLKIMELNDSRITSYATKELINRFGDNESKDNESIIAHLLSQADTYDDQTRNQIYSTIGNMGNKALSALPTLHKNLLASKNNYSMKKAIVRIVKSVYPSTEIDIPVFLNLLEIRDSALVKDVIGVLISHDCDYDMISGKLVQIMQNKDSDYREYAAGQLGDLGKNAISALPALLETSKGRDYSVQRKALESIRRIVNAYGPDDEVTIPFLITMIETNNKDCREKAISILSQWGPNTVNILPTLKKLLDDENATEEYGIYKVKKSVVTGAIISIIFRIDNKTDVDPEILLDLLEMEEGQIMTIIADKYMLLTDDYSKLIEKLVGFIEHGDDTVREKAINTFTARAVKLKDAVPALKQLLNRLDDDKRERINQIIKYMEKRNENAQKK